MSPRFKQVTFWFCGFPVGVVLCGLLAFASITQPWAAGGATAAAAFGIIVGKLGLPLLLGERRVRRHAHALLIARSVDYRVCPCGGDLRDLPEECVCPQCDREHEPDSLFRTWEGGDLEDALPFIWPPISERRLALAWWQWALFPMIVLLPLITYTLSPNNDNFTLFCIVVLTPILAAICGLVWYVIRGQHHDWRILRKQRFRRCPRCLRSLKHEVDAGACPRCDTEYTPDWLERTWALIYRKQGM